MIIRSYRPLDNEQIVDLFVNTVHATNAQDYTAQQLDAWAPRNIDVDFWCEPFLTDYTLIVEDNGEIVGFGNLDNTGYFDRLYVHKDYHRKGVGTMIADGIEEYARTHNICEVRTDASITAKLFFVMRGYKVIRENVVQRHGENLVNFSMLKTL